MTSSGVRASSHIGWVAVLDRDRYLGVLTPWSLQVALRRSVDNGLGVDHEDPVVTF